VFSAVDGGSASSDRASVVCSRKRPSKESYRVCCSRRRPSGEVAVVVEDIEETLLWLISAPFHVIAVISSSAH